MNGVEHKFREEYPEHVPPLDTEAAHHYLELAKRELGIDEIPPLSILVDDGSTGPILSQYSQAFFKRKLGLDIKIDIQSFKQRIDKMHAGNFDLVVAGWGPDYEDPFTFIELFASWNVNNKGRYNSPAYDALVRRVQGSSNQQVRMDAMGEAQQMLIDDAVILPAYERVVSVVQHPKLQGMQYKQVGAPMVFTYARVVE
jgi:oligopeptide transport system substrate-binding protein